MFAELMLPLLFLLIAGVIANRSLGVESKPLAKLTLYILSPALVFQSLYSSSLAGGELLKLAIATVMLTCSLAIVVSLICRICGFSAKLVGAIQLGSVFMNVGNLGLPIILGVCGQAGLERAAVIIVTHQLLMFSLAVYFAARSQFGAWQSFSRVFRMPTAYAALLALLLRQMAIALPSYLTKPISLLTQASIPIFLLLLGIQLSNMIFCCRWGILGLGISVKLGAAPLIASTLAQFLRLDLISRHTLILAAATPTAVVTTMLAIEFDAEPELVSSLTLVTTLLSLVTIPFIVSLLGLG